jgi:hypothetical protein
MWECCELHVIWYLLWCYARRIQFSWIIVFLSLHLKTSGQHVLDNETFVSQVVGVFAKQIVEGAVVTFYFLIICVVLQSNGEGWKIYLKPNELCRGSSVTCCSVCCRRRLLLCYVDWCNELSRKTSIRKWACQWCWNLKHFSVEPVR